MRARVGEQRREVGRLRLEMDDDGDAPAAQRAVREPLAREPVQDGECFATQRIRCSPSGASDGSAMVERAAASTRRIYPSNRLLLRIGARAKRVA